MRQHESNALRYEEVRAETAHEYTADEALFAIYLSDKYLENSVIAWALRLNLILANEAAYYMTHRDEGLETIRERFWESLK